MMVLERIKQKMIEAAKEAEERAKHEAEKKDRQAAIQAMAPEASTTIYLLVWWCKTNLFLTES